MVSLGRDGLDPIYPLCFCFLLSHITCYDSLSAAIFNRKAFNSFVNFVVMLVKLSLLKMQIAELENIQIHQDNGLGPTQWIFEPHNLNFFATTISANHFRLG